ncbi:diphthamide synthesis protein [Candidatus Pacearchaeota archaeon]|nr:diphthamide synthesis protein [Candidatus Pacearchaeota archaeon]
MEYDLETKKVVELVKKHEAKSVLLQLPDGLKQRAEEVINAIEENTDAKVMVWLGQCFGGCDIPITMIKRVDLIIQFGHNLFIKNPKGWRT